MSSYFQWVGLCNSLIDVNKAMAPIYSNEVVSVHELSQISTQDNLLL